MAPRGRPPTRSQSWAKSAAAGLEPQVVTTPEGNMQTLPKVPELPRPAQPQPPGPVPHSAALPAQLQAVSQLLDVLEHRSQGIIQQEMAAMAQAVANQQNPRGKIPQSPTRTAVSQRRPHPAYNPLPIDQPSEPVPRRKHYGKHLTPPSPPTSGSPSNSDSSSTDSSSSSLAQSPRRKKAKDKVKKFKENETRAHPSPFTFDIANTKIPKSLEKPPQLTIYIGRGDPDEHVDTCDLILDYRDASNHVRCKLFPLSIAMSALKWYRELPSGSISSWTQFTNLFSARFTTSRVKPKSTDLLQEVHQRENESLREYL